MNFPGIITVDLTKRGQQAYRVSGADRLWLAKVVLMNGVVTANDVQVRLSIRVDDPKNDALPWAIADGFMNSLSGAFSVIYVTVLSNPNSAAAMYLNTGNGVAAAYCNPDGLSPVVGGGASPYIPPALP